MTTIAKPMTPEAATLRDVAIALGVDPSGDVLVVARQAAAAAREVDTALLVLAAVDEPAEPLVAAVRRLLRERDEALSVRDGYVAAVCERDEALGMVEAAQARADELGERLRELRRERDEARATLADVRRDRDRAEEDRARAVRQAGMLGDQRERLIRERAEALGMVEAAQARAEAELLRDTERAEETGYGRAIRAVERVLDGEALVAVGIDADRVLQRVARLVADAERPSTQAPERAAILAGIDALGSSPADVDARNAARDAVRALGDEAPAEVLTADELDAVRGVLQRAEAWREARWEMDLDAFEVVCDRVAEAVAAWDRAGRPLAGEESEG